jgi:hypothetical protein
LIKNGLSAQLLKNALVNSLHIWYWACLWVADDPFWFLGDCVKVHGHRDFDYNKLACSNA